jgi:hypothetical protein
MATTTVAPTPTTPKTQTTTLTSASGERLRVVAKLKRKTGQVTVCVMHGSAKNGDGTRTNRRGMTTVHPSMDQAEKAVLAVVAQAIKAGWVQTQKTMAPKVDEFTTIPVPAKAPAPSKTPATTPKK